MPRTERPCVGIGVVRSYLDTITDIIDAIKAAMENRGLTVGDMPFEDYPDELRKLIPVSMPDQPDDPDDEVPEE